MYRHALAAVAAAVVLSGLDLPAHADPSPPPPTFSYAKRKDLKLSKVKGVEWTAAANFGLVQATGNSQSTTLSAGLNGSRKQGDNRILLDAQATYVHANILVAADANGNGVIDPGELTRQGQTTTESWQVAARYDRFFASKNSAYVQAHASADPPAGKQFLGGGQIGYSRRVLDTENHKIAVEVGYDLTYELFESGGSGVAIHSLRGFVGYTGKFNKVAGIDASVEALTNLNKLSYPSGPIDQLQDTRLDGQVAVTTKLASHLSVSASFAAKFDNAPSPLPAMMVPFAPGYVPLADKLDTLTKLSVIVSFL